VRRFLASLFVGGRLYCRGMDSTSLTRVGHPVVVALDAVSEALGLFVMKRG
jgi:hypothetical protein